MTMCLRTRPLLCAVASGALAGLALIGPGAAPAGALPNSGLCTLLPSLCPPTTPAPKIPPTTKAPVTTLPPKTSAPTTARTAGSTAATSAPAATTAPSTPKRVAQGPPAVGAAGLPAPAAPSGDLPALGTGTDPAAPQLAATPVPSTAALARPSTFPGLVGTAAGPSRGLPNGHAGVRLALSLLVLAIAGVAAAQLPASRRFPPPEDPVL